MRDILVALDLETTGLDPAIDRIIEVGAVKFQGDQILEEFQTLVDPGRSVPSHITHLTGLRDKDFIHAPIWSEVLPQVKHFVGAAPVVGHNIRFDIEFLHQNGLPLDNPLIDTFVLASVTHPSLPRYSLSSLVSLFDLEAEDAHRALNDSFMTAGLYQQLWKKAFELPLNTLTEIVEAGKNIPWDGHLFFAAVLRERLAEAKAEPSHDDL
nr:3'-5' exonuclease [Anaerolineae bacterium]